MIEASPLLDERKSALMNFIQSESERARQARKDDEAADSIEFYRGDKLGNEREGRSQVVTRDVAEVVDQALVNIMETMVSGDRVVTFEADEDEEAALGEGGQTLPATNAGDEATEAVHYQFMRKQNGYRILHDALKAGLLEKIGVVKTFKEQKYQIERFDVPALALADPEFIYDWLQDADGNPIEDGALIEDIPEIVSAYRRVALPPVIKDMTVPLEQFRISPDARDFESAALIGHDERVTLSDLRQMGFEVSETTYGNDNGSTLASTRDGGTIETGWQEGAGRVVTLSEDYVLFDYNGDGITERLCVHYVGNDILSVEEVDQQPFSGWVPFPMQHRYSGEALADKAKSFQAINTQILRSGIDSLFSALNPRITVDESAMSDNTIDDLLQPDLNAIIRYRGVAPSPWKTDDTSVSAFGAMEFMLSQRDSVTGINRHSQGLNPDSLNKTASGMAMLQDNADKVMKYLARNFAEMLVAPMFLKRYQLMRAFVQPFPMRIDGKRVMVTPSEWPHEIDMQINVGLGSNRREGRVQSKMTLAQIQREIASNGSRLVGEKEIFNTVKGIVRDLNVGGVPTDYVKDPDTLGPEEEQPSEAEMKAQAEQAKSAAELQFKMWEAEQRFAIEREKIEREDARERDRMDREFALAAERLMQPEAPAYHPGGALDR